MWGIALSLEGYAGLAAPSAPGVALRLGGAAAALRERIQRPVPLSARPLVAGWLDSARSQTDTADRERLWNEGRALGEDDAAALVATQFGFTTPASQVDPRAAGGRDSAASHTVSDGSPSSAEATLTERA